MTVLATPFLHRIHLIIQKVSIMTLGVSALLINPGNCVSAYAQDRSAPSVAEPTLAAQGAGSPTFYTSPSLFSSPSLYHTPSLCVTPSFHLMQSIIGASIASAGGLANTPYGTTSDTVYDSYIPLQTQEVLVLIPRDEDAPPAGVPPTSGSGASADLPTTQAQSQGGHIVFSSRMGQQDPNTGNFDAYGNVQAVYTDRASRKIVKMLAEELHYVAATQMVTARGNVRMERDEGTFAGEEMAFNLQTQAGYVTSAILETDYFRARGERISTNGDGSYVLENGVFTTCINGNPDYLIRARQLTVAPAQYISGRHVTIYLGGKRIVSVPSYRRSLKKGAVQFVPLPGYDRTDGPYVRLHDVPLIKDHRTFEYDARVNVRRLPVGQTAYEMDIAPPVFQAPPPRSILPTLVNPLKGILEQLTPPTYTEYSDSLFQSFIEPRSTAYAFGQNQQGVYNRRRTDLVLSRVEIGLRLINILGRRASRLKMKPTPKPNSDDSESVLGSTQEVLSRVPDAPFLLNVSAAISDIIEEPTDVTAGRAQLRTDLLSQPLIIGRRLSLRGGLTEWLSAYSTGNAYSLTSTEASLDYVPTRTSRFGFGYRNFHGLGHTPFVFDRLDLHNEGRLQYQVGGPWAFGILGRLDLDHGRIYDTEYAIVRNFDCMQVGLSYITRSQSINLIFHLNSPLASRRRRDSPELHKPVFAGSALKDTMASGF